MFEPLKFDRSTLAIDQRNTKQPGLSCSKLTMSLVIINMAYTLIFLLKKYEQKLVNSHSHFFSTNNCVLDIVLTRTVNILTTNELVKLVGCSEGVVYHVTGASN